MPHSYRTHGVVFQTFHDPIIHHTFVIVAQLAGAHEPVFERLPKTSLLYQVEAREQIVEIFRSEEGVHLADMLKTAKSAVWHIRKAFGIAEKQLGNSKTTQWRRRKSQLTQRSQPVAADDQADYEEES